MNRTTLHSGALLCVLVVLSLLVGSWSLGCASNRDDSANLNGRVWEATEIRTPQGLQPAISSQPVTMEIVDGTVSGSTGINRFGGTATTADGNAITFLIPTMTRMSGSPADTLVEDALLSGLRNATRYIVSGSQLKLQDERGNVQVSFRAAQSAPGTSTP